MHRQKQTQANAVKRRDTKEEKSNACSNWHPLAKREETQGQKGRKSRERTSFESDSQAEFNLFRLLLLVFPFLVGDRGLKRDQKRKPQKLGTGDMKKEWEEKTKSPESLFAFLSFETQAPANVFG